MQCKADNSPIGSALEVVADDATDFDIYPIGRGEDMSSGHEDGEECDGEHGGRGARLSGQVRRVGKQDKLRV